jgi:succinoglycan biosynthesis transport protein ExoP
MEISEKSIAAAFQPATSGATDGGRFAVPPGLLQFYATAIRWRWLMLGIVAGSLMLGAIVTLFMPPQYTAEVQLQIDRQQKQITKVEGIEAQTTTQDLEFYATQYELLRARPLAERVAASLALLDNQDFLEAHGVDPSQLTEGESRLSPVNLKARNTQIIVRLLLDNVEIEPIRTSKLVNISYTSRNSQLSTKIANEWAKAFIDASMDRQYASTADARKFLEERLIALRQRLEESEAQAVNYASRNDIVSLAEATDDEGRTIANRTLVGARLEELAKELNGATAARIAAESRSRSVGEATTEAVTSNSLSALRGQRATIAAEYAKKLVQLENGHPFVQELKQQLATADAAIAQENQRITRARNSEYVEASRREAELERQVNSLKRGLDSQNKANIQYAAFLREADTNRQIYDALLQRYKEIGVAGQVGVNNISIVEPAILPEKPSSPNLALNIIVAGLFGMLMAGLSAYALEQIDEGIRNPSQVESLLGLPLLGVTPLTLNDVIDDMADVKSALYDSYFSIRSNLAFSTNHGFPKSLAITSTRPEEGKSSTSIGLAITLGRTGKRVLLIDGDLRSPSIHKKLGMDNEFGLSNYLAGSDEWQKFVQETQLKNVRILSTGPQPPSAAELLSGGRLALLVELASAVYDHIVIDSPPVLGMTDAPLIAKAVESVVYVVQSAGAPVRGIRSSISRLVMVNARLAGVVLTKVNSDSMGYGYGYGYGYGQKYGVDSDDALRRDL